MNADWIVAGALVLSVVIVAFAFLYSASGTGGKDGVVSVVDQWTGAVVRICVVTECFNPAKQ